MSDFRGETLYFVFVDRFSARRAIPTDNPEFDATHQQWQLRFGGDLGGLIDRLDELAEIGASTVWLTPLFDQVDGLVSISGVDHAAYHGFWPVDLGRIDPNLVEDPASASLQAEGELDELIHALHARNMRLILDVTFNLPNTGDGSRRTRLFDDGKPIATFDGEEWGWHPGADAPGERIDEESYQWRAYIKDLYGRWLAKGVDGLRVDTVKSLPLWFWQEIASDLRVRRPGLFMMGEWFQGGCFDAGAVEFASLSGMTIADFAWRSAVVEALAHRSARGFEALDEVISRDVNYRDPSTLVTFVDNHDLPRFLSMSKDPERYRLALLLTLVARGIPCLFYGDERGLYEDHNRGNDPYNRPWMTFEGGSMLAADVAKIAKLRRENPAVQKGGMRKKYADPDRYVFTRVWLGSAVLVAVNRSDSPLDLGVTGLELPDGVFEDLLGGEPIEVGDASARVEVRPRQIAIYAVKATLPRGRVTVDVQVRGYKTAWGEDLYLLGSAPELGAWDVERAVKMEWINANSWGTTVAFEASRGKEITYKFITRRKGTVTREAGAGHVRMVPADGLPEGSPAWRVDAIWRDDWQG